MQYWTVTKIKLFSNFHERLLMADNSASEQDISDSSKASEVNSHFDDKSQMEPSSDCLPFSQTLS